MENLACKILDIFIYKFKRECDEDEYKDFSERIDCHNHNQIYFEEEERKFDFTSNPAMTFESALPLIFEDTLTEYIKELFLNLSCCNLQVPWIYVVQNRELLNRDNRYMDPSFDTEHQAKQKKEKEKEEHAKQKTSSLKNPSN